MRQDLSLYTFAVALSTRSDGITPIGQSTQHSSPLVRTLSMCNCAMFQCSRQADISRYSRAKMPPHADAIDHLLQDNRLQQSLFTVQPLSMLIKECLYPTYHHKHQTIAIWISSQPQTHDVPTSHFVRRSCNDSLALFPAEPGVCKATKNFGQQYTWQS